MELFGRAGNVVMVRICQPGAGPKSTAQLVPGADITMSNQARTACIDGTRSCLRTAMQRGAREAFCR